MRNYKQILEAVNRGINLALDDFDDQDLIGQQTETIKDTHYTKEYLDLLNNYVVDLGLPSGTLWCKYNLGCDYNKLNAYEYRKDNTRLNDWNGDFYAWGETKPKNTYGSHNYEFGKINNILKYQTQQNQCCNRKFNKPITLDNLTQLLPEDDAAYQNCHIHNFKFHIPTKAQWEELLKYTYTQWDNEYCCKYGLNGMIFISKINGKRLFLPASGFHSGDRFDCEGIEGTYWSSELDINDNNSALYTQFDCDGVVINLSVNRSIGISIRPVINL